MARPQAKIDVETIEKLGALGATISDAAAFFGVTRQTIDNRLRLAKYRDAWERGQGNLRLSLRRKQVELAERGDRTMLIWLGKNLLGQSDKLDTKLTGGGPAGEIQIDSSDARERILRRISETADPGSAANSAASSEPAAS